MDMTYPSDKVPAKSRKSMLTAFAIFLVPVISAAILLKTGWYTSLGTTNRGLLIDPPIELQELHLQATSTEPKEAKWQLLYVMPASCEQACKNSLHLTHQVEQAVRVDRHRVNRLIITPNENATAAIEHQTLSASENSEIAEASTAKANLSDLNSALQAAFPQGENPVEAGHIYLVDPQGFIFMHYPPQLDPKESILKGRDVLKDLQHVLKLSKVG